MLTEASKTTFDPNSDIKPTMLYPMNAQIDQINSDKLRYVLLPQPSKARAVGSDELVEISWLPPAVLLIPHQHQSQ